MPLVSEGGTRILIGCDTAWRMSGDVVARRDPADARRDHAHRLAKGAPCPVQATRETWLPRNSYPIAEHSFVLGRDPVEIGPMRRAAFAVEHSLRTAVAWNNCLDHRDPVDDARATLICIKVQTAGALKTAAVSSLPALRRVERSNR